jgi:antitoxin ParD1/3/4
MFLEGRARTMSNVRKVSVALTPELIAAVRDAVEPGEYASTSEVIREALRTWRVRRATRDLATAELQRLWQEGISSGSGRFASIDRIKKETRRRVRKAGA